MIEGDGEGNLETGKGIEARPFIAVLDHDRLAYFERWNGIFWNPDGPELRGRITVKYDDPYKTAERFPPEPPEEASDQPAAYHYSVPALPHRSDFNVAPTTDRNGMASHGVPADPSSGDGRFANQPERGFRAKLARLIQPKRSRLAE